MTCRLSPMLANRSGRGGAAAPAGAPANADPAITAAAVTRAPHVLIFVALFTLEVSTTRPLPKPHPPKPKPHPPKPKPHSPRPKPTPQNRENDAFISLGVPNSALSSPVVTCHAPATRWLGGLGPQRSAHSGD